MMGMPLFERTTSLEVSHQEMISGDLRALTQDPLTARVPSLFCEEDTFAISLGSLQVEDHIPEFALIPKREGYGGRNQPREGLIMEYSNDDW